MAERAFLAGGTGAQCNGCGETIGGLEKAYYVRMASAADALRFHLVCHQTWVRFKPTRARLLDRQ
jgi:hypothetical protein